MLGFGGKYIEMMDVVGELVDLSMLVWFGLVFGIDFWAYWKRD